jgi:photosystem II stability/assembly factor-like uncharacterized protein
MIGPFRGGRTVAVTGVAGAQNVFYMAPCDGGVWKSNDYGRTWKPIFDDQPTGSVGALAVAPSDPNILYVGSGEGLQRPDLSTGDGIYRSDNAGKTWAHLGLRDGQQIAALCVDPRNAQRLFAAVLGHPYGPNTERGVFRSSDGGATWQRVLYRDENTGATEVTFDPRNPDTLYAVLWAGRQAPWEIGSSWDGPGSGLYKSTDGGETWQPLTNGLPADPGRIGLGIAPGDPTRLYALVDGMPGGLYRSDDAGASWRKINGEERLWGRESDFAEVRVHPRNPDVVWIANTSTYRSTDGGATFTAIKGAPGGDDYHRIWINPENPDIVLLGVDQGATLSVNGGETWSSWYNQPTAQFYHVITDNRFPYWVYGAQQESGSAGVASRGDYGAITSRDWITVGAEEYGYIAPDPLHPDILYGGKLTRFDRSTGDVQDVAPEGLRSGRYRAVRTQPVVFSPVDRRALYFGANVVFVTRDGGRNWSVISPDLTRESYPIPANLGIFAPLDPEKGRHRGVIYTLAPSFRDAGVIWAGTDDGLIHVTRDSGRHWSNVTPPELTPWSKISLIEAGHFSAATAYAAINRFRLDDLRPHLLRTHDGGKTWREIVGGLPGNEVVNTVREDPEKPGLLFCGTERSVYFSLDDGDHWQPLRLNMPATSIRDLAIHEGDLIAGTHGRSFWILDDITPLREAAGPAVTASLWLFRPRIAVRVRRSRNTDTPLPPEEPVGENPPDGAILDFRIGTAVSGPVTLEILDATGKLVRRYASDDKPVEDDPKGLEIPTYWIRRPRTLPSTPGLHRWVWDLHYPEPDVAFHGYPIAAIPHDTPREPLGPEVAPGTYTIRLTAAGHTVTQPLVVRIDPRITTSPSDLARRQQLSMEVYEGIQAAAAALHKVTDLRTRLDALKGRRTGPAADAVSALLSRLDLLAPSDRVDGRRRRPTGTPPPSLDRSRGTLTGLLGLLQDTDAGPTTQGATQVGTQMAQLTLLLHEWENLEADANRLPAVP